LDFHQAGVLLPSGEGWLKQAGVNAAWVDLGKEDIHGNGHMTMLEKSGNAVAGRIKNWIDKALPERAASR
jgi:hypothetical protein